MNYYEHHIGDYAEATAHLSFVEDAAYSRCIRKYYAIEGPLPVDVKAVQRLVGARSKDERIAVDAVLGEFFTLQDDGWHNARCDEEIARYQDKRRKAKGSANARWSAKKSQSEGNTNAMRTHGEVDANALPTQSEGNALQSPVSSLQSEDSRRGEPPSVDQAIFAEARAIFGASIGGQISKAIKLKGKPWILGVIESCRKKDQEQARSYLAAAMNGAKKPDEAEARRTIA